MKSVPKVSVRESKMMGAHHQARSDGDCICPQIGQLQPATFCWTIGRSRAFPQAAPVHRPRL